MRLRLNRTYEWLKHSNSFRKSLISDALLNRTYEWLKLLKMCVCLINLLRWTVPMSDWNKRTLWILNQVLLPVRWTVPMSDWNKRGVDGFTICGIVFGSLLNRTYEWLKLELDSGLHLKFWKVEPYLWVIETRLGSQWTPAFFSGWTVPMSDMLLLLNSLFYTNTMNCFVNLQRKYE